MRLLVNTLSIGSMSGEHVVYGFLRELIQEPDLQIIVLHCESQPPPQDITQSIETIVVSNRLKGWAPRIVWEVSKLPKLVRENGIDRILNVSGGITPFIKTPQLSLAMNPWCFVKTARSGGREEFKAFMQRRSYRHAFRNAEHMIYISRHLRDLYRESNSDCLQGEAPSTIAYVGLDDVLFDAAGQLKDAERKPLSILSVSAWAPWKGLENLLQALRVIRESGTLATLTLAGPWPDAVYQKKVDELIKELQLENAVTILGKVSVPELHKLYATHQVYCLMSNCESFGIPAAEAMAFGTPVVSTDCCAIAEVCEGAGSFGPVDDPNWTAQALQIVMTDKVALVELSANARGNASRLTWQHCAEPFKNIPGMLGSRGISDDSAATLVDQSL